MHRRRQSRGRVGSSTLATPLRRGHEHRRQTISLNQILYTIIGVLPPGALLQDEALFLMPFVIDVDTDTVKWARGYHCCGAIGRLAPGVAASEAQAELRGIKQQLAAEYPLGKKDWGVSVASLQADLTGDVRPTLLILLGTVALVLLIACANVSNLLLARGSARAREMAIRAALGASSWRTIRQLLVESLLLALAGCALGLMLAALGIELLAKMLVGLVPQMLRPELDLDVLAFSILIACGCGLLFGLLPAVRGAAIQSCAKESERARCRQPGGVAVAAIVEEFALTSPADRGGLFLRSFARSGDRSGFNTKQTLDFEGGPQSSTRRPQPKTLLADRPELAALPGVAAVGAATTLPLSNRLRGSAVSRADKPAEDSYGVGDDFVSGDYFSALQIKLLRGRLITAADNDSAAPPVLVIDEKVARDLYPDKTRSAKRSTIKASPTRLWASCRASVMSG